jgi:hypothetical protein
LIPDLEVSVLPAGLVLDHLEQLLAGQVEEVLSGEG